MKSFISSLGLMPLMIFVAIGILAQKSLALDSSCIKTQVVRGDSCNNLLVNFDFSGCGETAAKSRSVRSSCVNQKAVAFVKDPSSVYISTYAAPLQAGGAWRLLTVRSEPRTPNAAAGAGASAGVDDMQIRLKRNDGKGSAAVSSEEIPSTDEPLKPLPSVAVIPVAPESAAAAAEVPLVAKETPAVINETATSDLVTPAPNPPPTTAPNAETKALEGEPAQAAVAKVAESAEKEKLAEKSKEETKSKESELKHSAFIDVYYQSAFNNPPPVISYATTNSVVNQIPAANVPYRAYDIYHDNISLALAELTLQKDFDRAGGRIDLGYGTNTYLMDPNDVAGQNVLQALVYYKFCDRMKLTVGKMFSNLTHEEAYSKDNYNYSRSLVFTYLEPLWHEGAALEVKIIPEQLAATLYAYNAWSGAYQTQAAQKMAALRLAWTLSKEVSAQYNGIMGTQTTLQGGVRQEHEANLTWKPNADSALVAEYVWGYQTSVFSGLDAQWNGFEVIAKQAWGKYSLAARYELVYDPQGYAIAGALANNPTGNYITQNIMSGTLTAAYEIQSDAKVLLEFRQDSSDQNVFKDVNNNPTTSQITGTIAFLYQL